MKWRNTEKCPKTVEMLVIRISSQNISSQIITKHNSHSWPFPIHSSQTGYDAILWDRRLLSDWRQTRVFYYNVIGCVWEGIVCLVQFVCVSFESKQTKASAVLNKWSLSRWETETGVQALLSSSLACLEIGGVCMCMCVCDEFRACYSAFLLFFIFFARVCDFRSPVWPSPRRRPSSKFVSCLVSIVLICAIITYVQNKYQDVLSTG